MLIDASISVTHPQFTFRNNGFEATGKSVSVIVIMEHRTRNIDAMIEKRHLLKN